MPKKEGRYAAGSAERAAGLRPGGEVAERFWRSVVKGPGCWAWRAGHSSPGYGAIYVRGRTLGAHRVAYWLTHGEIPSGLVVAHTCDNPGCVNPAHLVACRQRDNMQDKRTRERAAAGDRHGMAKLTAADVRRAFALRLAGWTQARIGRAIGVSQSHVSDLLSGRRGAWRTQAALRRAIGRPHDIPKERR